MTCHIWLFFVMFQRVIFCSKSTAFQIQRHWVPKNKYFKIMGNSLSDNHHPYPVLCDDELMNKKAHGTCPKPVMDNLRWGCDYKTADNICCYNRHYAEHSGYFEYTSSFLKEVDKNSETTYYDSVTGKALFIAPRGRSFSAFLTESQAHGWPSFRDDEVVWENVRCLKNGECVSIDGTHLGHNLPDRKGNRYCINLVSIAGRKLEE